MRRERKRTQHALADQAAAIAAGKVRAIRDAAGRADHRLPPPSGYETYRGPGWCGVLVQGPRAG
ncbi:hypothetical protein JYK14_27825 [Siccirubricoccus sp. KC 17139]|uniref:Uncharacterized protein n=1 Tax=Siccirubricoccus soli TaxID=2899147 RepID=A0ABT1DEA1_9PROT|nr:hypothetical protein [Siccirubricoccus soli]MCO6419942.1 hypothetical protein [Siccirubricoccus soli]MCP2686077.1 hypothetical protein [Siccirubricoccus soli]